MLRSVCVLALLAAVAAVPAAGQTIYPVSGAQILAGATFDLKIEFPGAVLAGYPKVTIDGENAAKVLGQPAQVIEREDGFDQTAYWIRGARLSKPGRHVVEASVGDAKATVDWEVYATPSGRIARNVILLIGDGMSTAHRTAARMLSKGIVEGRYGGELAMDDMPHMALVSTAGTDSIVTDSANAMTAYTTGHKTCVNALGVYCAKNRRSLDHPAVETIAELAKRKLGLAVGVVTDTEVEDATPAGLVAHTRLRADYDDIVRMYYTVRSEVILGGGAAHFLPKSNARGKRSDEDDYVAKFRAAGYAFADTASQLKALAAEPATRQLLGLFNDRNIDGALDRKFLKKGTVGKFPDQPDLTDEIRAALAVLSRHANGFLLMVEAGRIDKYSHALDWERAVYDTIMFDNAVRIAKEFAAGRDDTLIIVVPDHAHPVSIIGTYTDTPGAPLRERLQTYAAAKFPDYAPPDSEGYPPSVEASRRLAFVFAAYPDHCDAGRPYLAGENKPTVPGPDGEKRVANEDYCRPGAARRAGNLGLMMKDGVHAADDVILTASGPGAAVFRGRVDNTFVFRAMATALGLGQ